MGAGSGEVAGQHVLQMPAHASSQPAAGQQKKSRWEPQPFTKRVPEPPQRSLDFLKAIVADHNFQDLDQNDIMPVRSRIQHRGDAETCEMAMWRLIEAEYDIYDALLWHTIFHVICGSREAISTILAQVIAKHILVTLHVALAVAELLDNSFSDADYLPIV